MLKEIAGIALCYIYILEVIILSIKIEKENILSKEGTRKFVHILTSNYIFIQYFLNDNFLCAAIVPATFVIVNYLSHRYKIIESMERGEEDSFGTVWYVLSATILTIILYLLNMKFIFCISMLALGYGDGFAAMFSNKHKKHVLPNGKSLEGALMVFVFSGISTIIILLIEQKPIDIYIILSVATVAMTVESFTNNGYDNITIPFGVGFVLVITYFDLITKEFLVISDIVILVLYLTWYCRMVTLSATLLAIFLGIGIYAMVGISLLLAVFTFFISGSLISKISNDKKKEAICLHKRKGSRTWIQVLANTLPAFIFSICYCCSWCDGFIYASYVCLATANADTFASEIGMLSKHQPISIRTFKPLERGLSGGISFLGSCGSMLGSLLIALFTIEFPNTHIFIITFLMGIVGSFLDSVLGAFIQVKYVTENGKITEDNKKNNKYSIYSGVSWVNNDVVNFLSIFIAGMVSLMLFI